MSMAVSGPDGRPGRRRETEKGVMDSPLVRDLRVQEIGFRTSPVGDGKKESDLQIGSSFYRKCIPLIDQSLCSVDIRSSPRITVHPVLLPDLLETYPGSDPPSRTMSAPPTQGRRRRLVPTSPTEESKIRDSKV